MHHSAVKDLYCLFSVTSSSKSHNYITQKVLVSTKVDEDHFKCIHVHTQVDHPLFV